LLSAAILGATLAVFAAVSLHVLQEGAYERRAVGAMTLRAAVWLAVSAVAFRTIGRD
jgi:hypothetical protein